jgi:hypothetical protein
MFLEIGKNRLKVTPLLLETQVADSPSCNFAHVGLLFLVPCFFSNSCAAEKRSSFPSPDWFVGCLLNSGAEDEEVKVLAATTFAAFATLCILGADTPPVHGQRNVPRKTPSLHVSSSLGQKD